MDELGRALRGLALDACAGVVGPSPAALRRRGRRRVAVRVAGAIALVILGVAVTAPVWSHGGLLGPPVGPVRPGPDPTSRGGTGYPQPLPFGRVSSSFARWDAAVILSDGISPAQRAAVLARVRSLDAVSELHALSRQEAFQQFREQFRDVPGVLDRVSAGALPESVQVVLRRGADDYAELAERVCPNAVRDGVVPGHAPVGLDLADRCMPGVDVVIDTAQTLAPILGGRSWNGRADVAVVLTMEVTPERRAAILQRIESIDGVTGVQHETAEQAERRILREAPPGVSYTVPAEGRYMPESYRVRLTDPDRFPEFRARLCMSPSTGRCGEGIMIVIDQRLVSASAP
jgi:FtsX extracellular domain